MFKRFLLPAAMLLLASACDTQSAAPEWVELPAGFNLSLPAFRQLAEPQHRNLQPVSDFASPPMLASMQIDGEQLPAEYAQVAALGLIASPSQADAGFYDDAHLAFGQALGTSRGSYFLNEVELKVSRNGAQIGQSTGHESASCNCLHLFSPWGEIANTTISINGQCGHSASAKSKHDARLDWTGTEGKVTTILAASGTGNAHADQPSCAAGGGAGGGNNGEEYHDWYICYWEDYYDSNGNFTHRVELGCEPFNMF